MIASQRKLVIAGLIGNVLEWYDFSVYGYFAVSIWTSLLPFRKSDNFSARSIRRFRRGLSDAPHRRNSVWTYWRQLEPGESVVAVSTCDGRTDVPDGGHP